jgi:hypothetical protein
MASYSNSAGEIYAFFIECYSNKLTQEHDQLALQAVVRAAEDSFAENNKFQLPLNPLRIHLQLGKLTLPHFRTLLSTLDVELIRNRDDSGKLPIHLLVETRRPWKSWL